MQEPVVRGTASSSLEPRLEAEAAGAAEEAVGVQELEQDLAVCLGGP